MHLSIHSGWGFPVTYRYPIENWIRKRPVKIQGVGKLWVRFIRDAMVVLKFCSRFFSDTVRSVWNDVISRYWFIRRMEFYLDRSWPQFRSKLLECNGKVKVLKHNLLQEYDKQQFFNSERRYLNAGGLICNLTTKALDK